MHNDVQSIIDCIDHGCSVFHVEMTTNDDIFSAVAPAWSAKGKKAVCWGPWTGKKTSFNPLAGLVPSFRDQHTQATLRIISDTLYDMHDRYRGDHGSNSARVLQERDLLTKFMTLSLFHPDHDRNLEMVYKTIKNDLSVIRKYIWDSVKANRNNGEITDDILEAFSWLMEADDNADGNAYHQSILRSMAENMAIFGQSDVAPFIKGNDIDLDMVDVEQSLLCIQAPVFIPAAKTMAAIIVRMYGRLTTVDDGRARDTEVYSILSDVPSWCFGTYAEFV